MIKTIFAFGIFFLGTAHAAEQKVYSAQDLQKLGDGVFRELNLDGRGSVENINLLTSFFLADRKENTKTVILLV